MEQLITQCRKLMNRYIIESKTLFQVIGVPDGLLNILRKLRNSNFNENDLLDIRLSYDYDYFVFAKSTKTLIAIRHLLSCSDYCLTEDCYTLIRSIFENHIVSRHLRDNIDIEEKKETIIKDYIVAPLGLSFDSYYRDKGKTIKDKNNDKVGNERTPRSATDSSELAYYDLLYPFLCQYTHCNFSIAPEYLGEGGFSINTKKDDRLMVYALTIFAYSKVYEGIVTVEGEDFFDDKHKKRCYNLAYDSIELQMKVLDYLIEYYDKKELTRSQKLMEIYLGGSETNYSNKKISKMLTALKSALIDPELSSLDLSELIDGKFHRRYPKS